MSEENHAQEFAALLFQYGVERDESRIHGLITGYIAGGGDPMQPASLASIHREFARDAEQLGFAPQDAAEILAALLDNVTRGLLREDLGFELCVPSEDDADLIGRLVAVSDWSEGCLSGLSCGMPEDAVMSEDVEGIVVDLQTFAESFAAHNAEDAAEEGDDFDFHEIEQYLRVAAITLHDELGAATAEFRESAEEEDDDD